MRRKQRPTKGKDTAAITLRGNGKRRPPPLEAHRSRHPKVVTLAKHMRAFGLGEEGRKGREEFARRCGTSVAYLTHLALGFRLASAPTAIEIEKASHGLVRVEDMLPDIDWAYLAKRAESRMAAPRLRRVSA